MQLGIQPGQLAPPFGVNVIGFVSARLGLGVAARSSIAALVGAGVPVAVADVELKDGRSGYDQTWAHLRITDLSRLPHPVNLVHVNPPEASVIWQSYPHWFSSGFNCAVPFFELADIPDGWYSHLARYDAVLAPTEHISAAIRNSIAVPVRNFPIAADIRSVTPVSRSAMNVPENAFAFVTTWDTDSGLNRKNGVGIMRAFAHAFAGRSDVVLVLKVNGNARHPELERQIGMMPAGSTVVVGEYLPYAEVLGLYAACDAFVSLHRAEGLGLGLMETMLLGKPVIATGWSGNMDFMDDSCAGLVRFSFCPVVDTQFAYMPGQFTRPQLWAEPDLLHAAELMRRFVDEPAYRIAIANAGRARAAARRDAFFSPATTQTLQSVYGAANKTHAWAGA